ncbi:hypothetical protein ABVT39_004242 [Epinephelus coioides]
MSSDIYATPDLSKKVRYNRQVQEDTVESEERQVDIYESTDAIGNNHTDIQSHEGGPHTEKHPPAIQRRPLRVAAYCLGVLCLLMMTGIILSSILFTLEKDELQSRYDQLSNNYSQLQKQISSSGHQDYQPLTLTGTLQHAAMTKDNGHIEEIMSLRTGSVRNRFLVSLDEVNSDRRKGPVKFRLFKMSADALAAPDLSLNVRYTRDVQQNRGEGEEDQVEIFQDEEHHADLQSQKANIFVTLDKDELQSRYDQLSNNYSQLQKQIPNASVHYSQLQDEVKQLKDKIEGKWCPDGWSRFGSSCYFQSDEKKNWGQSRADCRQRGADLVIINNKEEQVLGTRTTNL